MKIDVINWNKNVLVADINWMRYIEFIYVHSVELLPENYYKNIQLYEF